MIKVEFILDTQHIKFDYNLDGVVNLIEAAAKHCMYYHRITDAYTTKVTAFGKDAEYILSHIGFIPYVHNAYEQKWAGPFAYFIIHNLKCRPIQQDF